MNWQMPKVEREKLGKWSGWRRVAYKKVRNPWSGRGWVPSRSQRGCKGSDRGGRNESSVGGRGAKRRTPPGSTAQSQLLGGTRATARPWAVGGL